MVTDTEQKIKLHEIYRPEDFPKWIDRDKLAVFLHESLKPYEDTVEDIQRSFDYAFSDSEGKGGYILIAEEGDSQKPIGSLVMLKTGMGGYIPEHVLLFVAVASEGRGKGIGGQIINHAFDLCKPDPVKLHVEYDNPAKRLYERLGMTTKYAEMRLER